MFYVTGKKVFSTQYNEAIKAYPEIKLVRNEHGLITLVPQETGAAEKPKRRSVCTAREVIAQLGSFAVEPQSTEPLTTSGK